jgi:glycosyltransferase involved in cell wall biosynthesis
MTIVHFATELTGGAGMFVRHVHEAMLGQGMPSLALTRERTDAPQTQRVRPMSRVWATARARGLGLLERRGVIRQPYALFGMEPAPLRVEDVIRALNGRQPTLLVFYWLSYFVSFGTIRELQAVLGDVPVAFVCLDESLLTGGCHYTYGCEGLTQGCQDCPGTTSSYLQRRIAHTFRDRLHAMAKIDAFIAYPTHALARLGQRSLLTRHARSAVLPLGAVTEQEWGRVQQGRRQAHELALKAPAARRLLVRSSTEHRKGSDLFAQALSQLSQRRAGLAQALEVVSIGDDALTTAGISRWVRHTHKGYVNRAGLIALYGQVDALAMTSREDAGPVMVNECVALGVFVLATPIGVAPDLLVDDTLGLMARDVTPAAFADVLDAWLARELTGPGVGASAITSVGPLTFEGYAQQLLALATSQRGEAG